MKTKMLVVVDMQNDFIDGSLGTKKAQAIVDNVAKKVKEYSENEDDIIFTRDSHTSNYLNTQEGKNLPVEHCIIGTKGWEINDKVAIKNFDNFPFGSMVKTIDKHTFGSVQLVKFLNVNNIMYDEIEIVGLCTDICVVSNALGIKMALGLSDTVVSVDASCCAGVTPEAHDHAIAVMKSCQIKIKNEGKEPWRE